MRQLVLCCLVVAMVFCQDGTEEEDSKVRKEVKYLNVAQGSFKSYFTVP